ncbi:hypothetical protein GCM10007916_10700 [Psychromonas marina]|uniref:Glycine-zipper-containing OmpA-like membrane domain-containing protein n=1 Tax=Psychromonas marina TaxID=88364 RepID=A0ABQ6DXX4_9GAMM|nr:glycine zipper family protein [Psychromonas marina]GLS90003.1 hypothetical protein GCM10007916_10700 [Psychromonas marina]
MNIIKSTTISMLLVAFSSASFANVIVDTQNLDMQKYHADMYECQQLSQQVQYGETNSVGQDMVSSTAKGAVIGAAGGAISGGSGSKGAKIGAGVGIVSGLLRHGAEKRNANAQYSNEQHSVMHNCLVGRGYTVLN